MRWILFRTPSCLLWDCDGTLIDTTSLIVESLDFIYQKHFARTLPEAELRALIGTPLKKQIRVFGELEALGVAEEAITEDFITYYEAHRSQERILEEVIAVLQEGKRRGFPTGLVTSKNDAELANTLPRLDIAAYLDVAITADNVIHPKPAPEGILLALQQLAIPQEMFSQAVYIGDTIHDMQAARAAGVQGIGVTWGAATHAQLSAESPVAICDIPQELHTLLLT